MADIEIALKELYGDEGAYDNNPKDRGNWTGGEIGKGVLAGTKYGITCLEVGKYLGLGPAEITVEAIKNFPLKDAAIIYKKDYWRVMRGNEIENQDSANSIFNFGVNVGIGTGIGKWQASIGVPVTNKMDDYTLRKTNEKL